MAMSNDYFEFKQFRVGQERCAMKVTTDACIQGAWTPVLPDVKQVLDIGTGTGLLAIMLAQRSANVIIDAIEFDADAAQQAQENITASPWNDRINIIERDVRGYSFLHKYDLIISNPPFFNNSLLSNDVNKDMARHTLHLSFNDLLHVIITNLADDGYASILLPYPEYQLWNALALEAGLFEIDKLLISHTEHAPVKRVVSIFSKKEPSFVDEEKLYIKDAGQNYAQDFIDLLSPFYLNL
jgi:tRNA1Val (adenine37-N6)-methyltransferase